MKTIPNDYVERLYAGWLGKLIGIRHGAPIEGWLHERIAMAYGEIDHYLVDYKDFAADDDSNGPTFFLRALKDYTYTESLTPEQIGLTWLNYAPYEHGFYWWGGYGKSTEHTAYLNLRNGIMAPASGSADQNGMAVAEQIGGQIFIDTWGLAIPVDYKKAARYAEKAASVSHDFNGKYGGMFIAACISAAFVEQDIRKIIEKGLSVIPESCEYTRMARAVMGYYDDNPDDWKAAFYKVKSEFGYDRYPGTCPIIPNAAVVILSLLYGKGDFSRSINICNMCGWDTDCNVANVGTIMGVRNGLNGIDRKWRAPINDFIVCSSVIGSLNIVDIPESVLFIAKYGYLIAGEEPPEKWKTLMESKGKRFHFELPGSTHGFRWKSDMKNMEVQLSHSTDTAYDGTGSLKVVVNQFPPSETVKVYYKTYYRPEDFHDNRYEPAFSPVLYPGQHIKCNIMLSKECQSEIAACLYIRDGNGEQEFYSENTILPSGQWQSLHFDIPPMEGVCIEEVGVKLMLTKGFMPSIQYIPATVVAYLDDFCLEGSPCYKIDFSKERTEIWTGLQREISQFTYLKGMWNLEDGELSGSGYDYAEAYTGDINWNDYVYEAVMIPKRGASHCISFRVQGAIRSYAVGLDYGKAVLLKNQNGYTQLSAVPYSWQVGESYTIRVKVIGANITVWINGEKVLEYTDNQEPYLTGQVGVCVLGQGHCHYRDLKIERAEE